MASPERPASPPGEHRKKRIPNACLQCKQKKKRCDGAVPRCLSCTERHLACTYLEIRRRGRGKAKSYLEKLEARVAELEASMHSSANGPVESNSSNTAAADARPTAENPSETYDTEPQSTITNCPVYREPEARLSAEQPAEPQSTHERMQAALREKLFATLPERTAIEEALQEPNRSPFTSQIFIELPPKVYLESLLLGGVDELHYSLPLFDTRIVADLVQEYSSNPTLPRGRYPERWAMLNAAIAVTMQVRAARGSHSEMMQLSFHFFRNAFSMYAALTVRGADILALEALLAMAVYIRGFSDTRTTSTLVSTAARLALSLGLHQKTFYSTQDLTPAKRNRHIRVFWIAYLLDKDISMRTGLPSNFDDDAITLDLPGPELISTASSQEPTIPDASTFFQCRINLATIESKVERRLRPFSSGSTSSFPSAPRQTLGQVMSLVQNLEIQMETWNESLPSILRPLKEINWSEIPPDTRGPIISFHFVYYRIVGETHSFALAHLKQDVEAEAAAGVDISPMRLGQIKFLTITQAFAAGQIISLMQHLPWQQPGHLWYLLHYPLAACITLVAIVLDNPTDPQACPCARDIGDFVKFLQKVQRENTLDVQPLLDLVCALESLVLRANSDTAAPRGVELGLGLGFDPRNDAIPRRTELNLDILSHANGGTISSMQLACGLMGNMPNLRSVAARAFSSLVPGVQQISSPASSSASLLAPLSLDPDTYGFVFA
ncbi:fungal-specific transcription factor domain-containing protein [Aspergillus pseudoustus]|uniref:Fungal-specific transcription factor domain-containing protein n=1 Tax=Aspergillus pseudoustus TaxID=1810923 RepID=A0ABR4JQ80_9EURO